MKQAKRNAYLYCKIRDEQFSLYDAYCKRHGMSMNLFLVVNALYYAKDGLTQTEICNRVFRSKQTVNIIIANLFEEGSVDIIKANKDKRNKLVKMNDKGRETYEKSVRHITVSEDMAMSMFSLEEQQLLVGLSRTFTQNLSKLINNGSEV